MVNKISEKNYKKGMVVLEGVRFDHMFKRKVMRHSDTAGKIYLPKELVGKTVCVIVDVNGVNED